MADLTKRTASKLARHLDRAERVEVAFLVEPRGNYGLGMFALAAAPSTATKVLSDRSEEVAAGEQGMASRFPAGGCVVAVTGRRILVVPSNGLRFDAPELEVSRGGLPVGEITSRGLGRRMDLVFGDGSAVTVDVHRGQPLDRLIDALGRAL